MRNKCIKLFVFFAIEFLLISFTFLPSTANAAASPNNPINPINPTGEPGSYWVTRTASNSNSTVNLYLQLKVQYSIWTDRTLYGEADYSVTVKRYPYYYVLAYSSFTYGTVYSSGQNVGLMTVHRPQTFTWYEWHGGDPYGTINAYLSAAGIYVTLSL